MNKLDLNDYQTIEKIKNFNSKRELYELLNISGNNKGVKITNDILTQLGLGIDYYKKKRHKIIKCLNCGKEFHPCQSTTKFCCRSCSASYNNKKRDKKTIEQNSFLYYSRHRMIA